jgi:hypothetical protein
MEKPRIQSKATGRYITMDAMEEVLRKKKISYARGDGRCTNNSHLKEAERLRSKCSSAAAAAAMRDGFGVIAEPLHNHRYATLWELVFNRSGGGRSRGARGHTISSKEPTPKIDADR